MNLTLTLEEEKLQGINKKAIISFLSLNPRGLPLQGHLLVGRQKQRSFWRKEVSWKEEGWASLMSLGPGSLSSAE